MNTLSAKSEKDLQQLPQIGPARAKKIIQEKPRDVYELSSIAGLSKKRMDVIISFLKDNDFKLEF
ncbi:helix-hairpin-helix domain-containing protein [Xanthomarina gelatinilytica]|uniref:helix-hairpin-helix domain-containing protein n=1 Tax=Xanthomarina gelatinilytica TaxID=1137281 RepID=UPI003AA993A2